jgi:hypothetical protein
MLLLKNPIMATLLTYYPSPALTQAEKNLARWQAEYTKKAAVVEAVRAEAMQIFPLAFAHARIMTAESNLSRVAGFVEQAKNMVAAERASAYLSHTAAATRAAEDTTSWLSKAAGKLVLALIQLVPSRVSAPPTFA